MNVNEINFLFAVERRSFISAAGQGCEGLQYYHLKKKKKSQKYNRDKGSAGGAQTTRAPPEWRHED